MTEVFVYIFVVDKCFFKCVDVVTVVYCFVTLAGDSKPQAAGSRVQL